jgi:hypothetical protein
MSDFDKRLMDRYLATTESCCPGCGRAPGPCHDRMNWAERTRHYSCACGFRFYCSGFDCTLYETRREGEQ